MAAVDLSITGRVQGVAFRIYAQREAERLGVTGWVRNEPDGSVRVRAEGPADAVSLLVDWCRHGPAGARVRWVEVVEVQEAGAADFRIRY